MIVNPFWLGVFATVFLEMAVLIILALWRSTRK